ncbi:MAG TPA: hypothetical protein VFT82_02915 [Candidatus Paceibacterota bacterium]|nr:hypothetical protein [Candidatus Paceibacterota bacterium]
MTPEEKQLLIETRRLVEENAVILRSIQRSQRAGTYLKVAYWIVILALSFGAYYLIQPYVNTLNSSLGQITGNSAFTSLGQ